MTDDITRGLAALADEARPAPLDSHTVVQLAHAHTRARRAIVASAFATIVAAGALVVAFTTLGGTSGEDVAAPPTTSTPAPNRMESYRPATPEENAERRPRLQAELTAAFDRILPDGWQHSTFAFGCDRTGCFAGGDLVDEFGPLTVHFYTSTESNFGPISCTDPECTYVNLDDGTTVGLLKSRNDNVTGELQDQRDIMAVRPDGTTTTMSVRWPVNRPAPAVTDQQWMEFGAALTY